MNRRDWLSLVLASSASTLLMPRLGAMDKTANSTIRYGLFFDPARLDEIRNNYLHDPAFAELRERHGQFDYAGEEAWMDNELRYNDQLYDIARLGNTATEMAFLSLMTGDPRARNLAIRAIREIMRFERWDFFLDEDLPISVQRGSQTTVAISLVIDFLGDHLERGERRSWLKTMWEKGCLSCFRTIEDIRHPSSVTGWRFDPESTFLEHRPGARTDMNRRPEITFDTNLRAVPASALVIGTVAYELEFGSDEKTRPLREMGIWGLEDFREFFKEDGSYNEETGYAYYTALHIAQAVIILRRHGGPDMTDIINWDAFVDFLLNMSMPTEADPYAVVNFGDSGRHPGNLHALQRTALPLWIARENQNGLARGYAERQGGLPDLWSALWFDASVKPVYPPNTPRLWISALDRVVARTGFEKEHLVVAMRSGPPSNHEHADRNSVIIKCFGEELVTDPLRPPYGYSDPSWRLRLTEGHSAILIDGSGHEHHNGVEGTNPSNSYARIVQHGGNERYATWISDATQPYRRVDTEIKSVTRSMAVFYGVPAVVIVDRVAKWNRESTVQARFFGYNLDGKLHLSAARDGFEIQRPGAMLSARTACNVPCSCGTGILDIPREVAEHHPYVDVLADPAKEVTLVTVLSLAKTGSPMPGIRINRQGPDFHITVGPESLTVEGGTIRIRS